MARARLRWLINLYRHSRDWGELLSAGTRKQRGPILKQIENAAGDLPIAAITRKKIEEGISARTPNQGRHFKNTASALFKWAVEHELYDRNPTDGIKVTRGDGEGHLAWPIEMIEQFEQRWPLGTKQRLVFDVFLYIGLRRGDAARLGKQHIRNGVVHLMTEKSGGTMPIYVPVHPALAASMAACPSSGLAIIAKDDGTNYGKEGLGNFFREAVAAAGIPVSKKGSDEKGYSAHGLRKASRDHRRRKRRDRSRAERDVWLERLSDGAALHQESRPQAAGRPRARQVDAALVGRGGGATRTRTFASGKRTRLEHRSLPPMGRW